MKIRTIFITLSIVGFLIILACTPQGNSKQNVSHRDTPIVRSQKIQHTFFDITLGETTLQEAENICLKNGWKYTVQDGYGEIAIDVQSPVTFGGIQWNQGLEFCFLNDKSAYTTFTMINGAKPLSNSQLKAYSTLLSKLKSLYPKHKIVTDTVIKSYKKSEIVVATEFYAKDSIYSVNLEKSVGGSRNSIILMYSIRDDKIDKIIPSDL